MIALAILAALFAVDARRAPARQFGTRLTLMVIDGWQAVSPTLAPHARCLYTPSCSVYGELAVRRYGVFHGGWLALKRIWRCSPWAETSGEDWP